MSETRYYGAGLDDFGVFIVEPLHGDPDEEMTAGLAVDYPSVIYFAVEPPIPEVDVIHHQLIDLVNHQRDRFGYTAPRLRDIIATWNRWQPDRQIYTGS